MRRMGMGRLPMIVAALSLALISDPVGAAPEAGKLATDARAGKRVKSLRIYLMSTAVAGAQSMKGFGEWGFAALVEADDRTFLFDTGLYSDTVARNADELGVNLAKVSDVVLSHNPRQGHRPGSAGEVRVRQGVRMTARWVPSSTAGPR